MNRAYKKRPEALYLLFAVLAGLVLLFILAPLVNMFLSCSVPQLIESIRDRQVSGSIRLTLWTSMAATLIFALAAIPFAYLLARKDFALKALVNALVDVPIAVPHSAAGIALLGVLSRSSLVGGAAGKIGLAVVGGPAGIMAAMAFVSIPYLINSARDGFLAVPRRLEQAALNLGASPCRVFLTISVPLAWRSILSGLVSMWARGMSEFGAVLVIAYHPMTTPVLMYERLLNFGLSYARPVAAVFVAICLALFIALRIFAAGGGIAQR